MLNFEPKVKTVEITVQEGTTRLSQSTVADVVKAYMRERHRNIHPSDEIRVSFLDPNRTDDAVIVTVTRHEQG
ncbi:hypothetical protein F406_gp048 [Agrobacterium phage 7-7-1]|uniref:Uncharacterized protein n=1 Tax=Agrobacterium phage 7-7-1 TaxID=1161931 RepID=J7F9F1_9CAUD|nr:hypothetical protein F406_gp048 [Agrobacterium phage 7-7-1]AFH19767.1 hypothetical protein 7-7-1_00069 [Agrobacterium phage 7-7-1]